MASGSFSVSTSNQYLSGTVSWSSTADTVNNQSTVTASLRLSRTNSGYTTYGTGTYYLTIYGNNKSSTQYNEFTQNSNTLVISHTVTVPHNADGTMSCYIEWSGGISGVFSINYGSGIAYLDNIPRSSSISSFPDFTLGNGATINPPCTISAASGGFTHKLHLYVGSTFVKEFYPVGGGANTLALTDAEQNIIYQAIPNAQTASMVLYCKTFNGSSEVGGWVSATCTATINPGVAPTFTFVEANITEGTTSPDVNTLVGKFVKSISKLKTRVTGASSLKYATLPANATRITLESVNYNGTTMTLNGSTYDSDYITTNVLNTSGTVTVTARVTDSRGMYTEKTVTLTGNSAVLDYSTPLITGLTLQRWSAASGGVASNTGQYIKVSITGSVISLYNKTTLLEKNSLTYSIESKLRGQPDTSYVVKKSATIVGLTLNVADIVGANDYLSTSAYDFRIKVNDKFYTTMSLGTVSTGLAVMSWSKTGVGIGKIWQQGVLDVLGDTYTTGNNYLTGNNSITGNETISGDLTVSGNLMQNGYIKHDFTTQKVYHNVCNFRQASYPTGTMVIKLPTGWSNTMMNIKISGYDYTYGAFELQLGGYNFDGGGSGGYWNCTSATAMGVAPFGNRVVFCYEASSGKCCILLGAPTTAWHYPHLNIETVQVSHLGIDTVNFGTGWSISLVTSETAYSATTTLDCYMLPYERRFSVNTSYTDPAVGINCCIKGNGDIATTGALRTGDWLYSKNGVYKTNGTYGVHSNGDATNITYIRFMQQANPYVEYQAPSYGTYGGTVWASDISLKENIVDSTYAALDKIIAIEHMAFDYKTGGHIENGYISQKLMAIDKDWVFGVDQEDGTTLYQPSVNTIVPAITKAIQEMKVIIDNQASLIEAQGKLIEELRIKVGI